MVFVAKVTIQLFPTIFDVAKKKKKRQKIRNFLIYFVLPIFFFLVLETIIPFSIELFDTIIMIPVDVRRKKKRSYCLSVLIG